VLSKNPEKAFSSLLDQLLRMLAIGFRVFLAAQFFQTVRNRPVLTRDPKQMREALAWGIRPLEAVER